MYRHRYERLKENHDQSEQLGNERQLGRGGVNSLQGFMSTFEYQKNELSQPSGEKKSDSQKASSEPGGSSQEREIRVQQQEQIKQNIEELSKRVDSFPESYAQSCKNSDRLMRTYHEYKAISKDLQDIESKMKENGSSDQDLKDKIDAIKNTMNPPKKFPFMKLCEKAEIEKEQIKQKAEKLSEHLNNFMERSNTIHEDSSRLISTYREYKDISKDLQDIESKMDNCIARDQDLKGQINAIKNTIDSIKDSSWIKLGKIQEFKENLEKRENDFIGKIKQISLNCMENLEKMNTMEEKEYLSLSHNILEHKEKRGIPLKETYESAIGLYKKVSFIKELLNDDVKNLNNYIKDANEFNNKVNKYVNNELKLGKSEEHEKNLKNINDKAQEYAKSVKSFKEGVNKFAKNAEEFKEKVISLAEDTPFNIEYKARLLTDKGSIENYIVQFSQREYKNLQDNYSNVKNKVQECKNNKEILDNVIRFYKSATTLHEQISYAVDVLGESQYKDLLETHKEGVKEIKQEIEKTIKAYSSAAPLSGDASRRGPDESVDWDSVDRRERHQKFVGLEKRFNNCLEEVLRVLNDKDKNTVKENYTSDFEKMKERYKNLTQGSLDEIEQYIKNLEAYAKVSNKIEKE